MVDEEALEQGLPFCTQGILQNGTERNIQFFLENQVEISLKLKMKESMNDFSHEFVSPSINKLFHQMEEFFVNKDITYSVCEKCNGLNRVVFSFPDGKSPVCGRCKSSLTLHDGVNDLTVSSLETLSLKSPLPVVVDFWAPWCGPCRSFAPTFIDAANRLKSRIVFGKINTESNPDAGQKFSIKGIPTLVLFYHGKEINRISGALPIDAFLGWVNQSTQALN